MRQIFRNHPALPLSIILILAAAGCKPNGGQTHRSTGSQGAPGSDVKELRLSAQDKDQNPPSGEEKSAAASLWSAISELAPPPGFMGRDPMEKNVAEQNLLFVASEISLAVEEAGLQREIPTAIIRATVDVALHHMSREDREKLKGCEAPVRLTAVSCFLMLSNRIGRESGFDQPAMYLQRMNLQVRMDQKQLTLQTKMPEGTGQDWPKIWMRLFTACFHRPLIILPTDPLRRDLWNWIDGKPTIEVRARDGSVLAVETLSVSTKDP